VSSTIKSVNAGGPFLYCRPKSVTQTGTNRRSRLEQLRPQLLDVTQTQVWAGSNLMNMPLNCAIFQVLFEQVSTCPVTA